MIHRLITWAKRRREEHLRSILRSTVNEAWDDSHKLDLARAARARAKWLYDYAVNRGDTRDMNRYAEALRRATTEVLRAEIAR